MKKTDFNKNWEFQWGEPSNIPMIQTEKKIVNLPYDFVIGTDVECDAPGGSETGYYRGRTASYTKYFDVSEEELQTPHILSFDGCYGITKVVINGHVAARHHYGYTPFCVRMNDYLTVGKNRVTVTVSNTNEPNTRWYSGGGLYRKAYLLTSPKVHIVPEGIYTYTENIFFRKETEAVQFVEVTLENEENVQMPAKISVQITDKRTGKQISSEKQEVELKASETDKVVLKLEMHKVKLWELDNPQLYQVSVCVESEAGQDQGTAIFGVRKIEVDADNGFRLNGKSINLKGGCIHHDNGIIGAAAYRESEYRKVALHKAAGFQALRMAHNPPSRELLEACDEFGMLVIDEAFDVWNMEKDFYDFSQFFEKEWQQELSAMLLRDRNHPCIFCWSIGNEIVEQGGLSNGYKVSEMLTSFVRKLDGTRPVGGALCSFFHGLNDSDNENYWKSVLNNAAQLQENGMVNLDCEFGQKIWDPYTTPFVKNWDIVGYNYLQYQYEPTHETHPDRVICCTESKPRELADYWKAVEMLPYVIGDFEWTSMDYIGEAGIGNTFYVDKEDAGSMRQRMFQAQYPARTAEAGDFDICGFEKPQLYYRKAVWGAEETYLVTYNPATYNKVELLGRYGWGDCARSWTWQAEAGSFIKVEVYSRAETVELFVNGKSLGRKPAGYANDYRAVWNTVYEPGQVRAISYDVYGKIVSEDCLKTAGTPVKLSVKKDPVLEDLRNCRILSDVHAEVDYYVIEVTDANGDLVPYAEWKITAKDLGLAEGKLLALGTGRSVTEENYSKGEITTFHGRALAIFSRK